MKYDLLVNYSKPSDLLKSLDETGSICCISVSANLLGYITFIQKALCDYFDKENIPVKFVFVDNSVGVNNED